MKAYVVLRDPKGATPEDGRSAAGLREGRDRPYKYPRAVEFVEQLPRTETGKLQRFGSDGLQGDPAMTPILPAGLAAAEGLQQRRRRGGPAIFVAGMVGWNPESCQFETDDFAGQFRQTLENVVAVLRAAGRGAASTWRARPGTSPTRPPIWPRSLRVGARLARDRGAALSGHGGGRGEGR